MRSELNIIFKMNINDKYIDQLPDEHKKSYLDYKAGKFNTEEWGSHQPLLIHVLNTIDTGDVFEFGMGYNSTPIFNTICGNQKRNVLSIDFDFDWFNKFTHYQSDWHKIMCLDVDLFKGKRYDFLNKHYSVLFVDAGPAWTRPMMIDFMKNNVDYIIAHDTNDAAENKLVVGYGYDFSGFKHVHHFKKVRRNSTLVSNLNEINPDLLKIF